MAGPDVPRFPPRRRWPFVVGVVVLILSATALFIAFIVDGLDVELATVRPWLFLVVSLLLGLVSVLVHSLAPFGPNLIPKLSERLETISTVGSKLQQTFGSHWEFVLVLAGSGLVVGGTLYYFDYGDVAADSPSAWWIAPVIVGVFVAVVGVAVGGDREHDGEG